MVGRPRHHGLVERSVAERVFRHLRRIQGRSRPDARVGNVERLRRYAGPPLQPRRPRVHSPRLLRGTQRQTGDRALRRHHLLEGSRRRTHARGLPGCRSFSQRRTRLPRTLPREQRHGGRFLARAERGFRPGRRRDRQRLDQAAGTSAGQHRGPRRGWRPEAGDRSTPLLRRPASGGRRRPALADPHGSQIRDRRQGPRAPSAGRRRGRQLSSCRRRDGSIRTGTEPASIGSP